MGFEVDIYTAEGKLRCTATNLEYNGSWMEERYVSVDIVSEEPIDFNIGDWLEYRGERFEINSLPSVDMVALKKTYGGAYKYDGVKFNSLAEELVNCSFLDYVLNDNQYHFTSLPNFSFYAATVKDLADRIQANMNRWSEQNSKPKWEIEVHPEYADKTDVNISVDNVSCYDALILAENEFGAHFTIVGRTITIGTAGLPVGHLFQMGKDNGLYEIERTTDNDQKITTRLRAYGSDRNLPHRYYNSLTHADGTKMIPDNMAVNRLMLPGFPETTQDPYIDSPNIEELGVRESTVIFDGSNDLEEIYPSLEETTAEDLKNAGIETNASGRLDEIVAALQVEDNGVGTVEGSEVIPDTETFIIEVKDWGFDINELWTEDTPYISFKSGMLGGREFEIVQTGEEKPTWTGFGWRLYLKRVYDDSLKLWFPYSLYNAKPGDRFVLLGIEMPEAYIKIASQRLLTAAEKWLSENDYARFVYNPKIDEIFMADQHQRYLRGQEQQSIYLTIREGDLLTFEEDSLSLGVSTIFIDKLTIKEGQKSVPTYDITLREEKSVGSLQRIQNQIDSIKSGGTGNGGGGGYTTEQLKQLVRSLGSSMFLSKLTADATPYDLTIGGVLSVIQGLFIGSYLAGESGAVISKDGQAELASLFVRGTAKIIQDVIMGANADIAGDTTIGGDLTIGDYLSKQLGAIITKEGSAELLELFVRNDSAFGGDLSSEEFISGFISGKGWAITREAVYNALGIPEDKYTLEIDNLIVRGMLRVYEMVISQLLGENDNRIFTAMLEVDHYDPETGRIWLDTMGGKYYNPFRKGDYIMVEQYNGMPSEENGYYVTKEYELVITDAGIGNMADGENRLDWVEFKNFTSQISGATAEELIAKGDTLVRVDNETDPDRKGIIQIMTVGNKTPYIDILYGMKTDPENYLKGRLGNLEGIRHNLFGWLYGFGEYLTNLYAVGDFRIARTGDSIDTQIEILKDRYSSQYSRLTYDITEEDNLLFNTSFTSNMEGWEVLSDSMKVVGTGEDEFLVNGNLIVSDASKATLTDYDGRDMLYIYDSGIRQKNSLITKPDTHLEYDHSQGTASNWDTKVSDNTQTSSVSKKNTLYLAIKFLAKTSGNLTIGFSGSESDSDSLPDAKTSIAVKGSSQWQTMEWQGTWDGKGDFVLEYSGEMYVSHLSLTSDPLGDYKKEIGTQILQTERNIQLLANNVDAKTGHMGELGIMIDAVDEKITLYAKTTDETLSGIKQNIASIEITAESITSQVAELENGVEQAKSSITQTANEIRLEVQDVKEGLESTITQTANEIKLEVADKEKGLQSQIDVLSGKIELRVTNEAFNSFKSKDFKNVQDDIADINKTLANLDIPDISDLNDMFDAIRNGLKDSQGNPIEFSQFVQTVNTINASVTKIEGDLDEKWASLSQSVLTLETDYAQLGTIYVRQDELGTLVQGAGFLSTDEAASLYAATSYVDDITGELSSRASSIEATINNFSATYVEQGNVIAAINGDSSGVTIIGTKISLEGYTSINNSFSVDTQGNINLYGIVRYSTDYVDYGVHNKDEKAMIVNIRPYSQTITVELRADKEQLGKIYKIYNENPIGSPSHYVYAPKFSYSDNSTQVTSGLNYSVGPQEFIEMTCMQMNANEAQWVATNRFTYQEFRKTPTLGRFPLVYAMGKMNCVRTSSGFTVSLTGYFNDGTALSSKISVSRTNRGRYTFSFASGTLPSGYLVFVQAYKGFDNNENQTSFNKITIDECTDTMVSFIAADDDSENDGPFDFMIFDNANWYYNA